MILEDFVMLGTTVPEPSKRSGRTFVCSAGVSEERRSLVRLYPLSRRGIPHRWKQYRVPIELNPEDTRPESYKVAGDRSLGAHERINERFEELGVIHARHRSTLLRPYVVDSIAEANRRLDHRGRHMSLAVIHPDCLELDFDHNQDSPDSPELRLFDLGPRPAEGAKRFAYIPRLRFRDEAGEHRLMLRDWGCFEWMRKQGDARRTELVNTLHLDSMSSLLVGNFNQHRSSWLVISVLNGLRDAQMSLLDAEGDVA